MAMRYCSMMPYPHRNGLAIDQDLALVRYFETDDVFEQNAFAAAARSHDDEDLAGRHLEDRSP